MVNANDLGKGGDGVGVNSEKERLTAYDYLKVSANVSSFALSFEATSHPAHSSRILPTCNRVRPCASPRVANRCNSA